jgi:predicted ATPase
LHAVLGEAIALSGDIEGGLATIEESLAVIERQGERSHLAEVLRLKGWMLQRQGKFAEAAEALTAAIDVAREQRAKSWELRATMTLVRSRLEQDDRAGASRAREELGVVYAWFTEGHETKDLRDARGLLTE